MPDISLALYAAVLFCLTVLGTFSLRWDGWRKWVSPFVPFLVAVAFLYAWTGALGSPKPWDGKDVNVIYIMYVEGKAIYVYGVYTGSDVPVSIVLPWSKDAAKKASDTQESNGAGGIILHHDSSGEPDFGAAPNNAPSKDDSP